MVRFSLPGKNEKWFVLALVMIALFFWTLPMQQSQMPFGDVDAPAHFTISDYMAKTNMPMYLLPPYISYMYGSLANGKLWYSPQFHLDAAIAQRTSGSRILGFYLFVTVMSMMFVFSSYLLIRKLYGFLPAFISSFALIFSVRDYQTFLWALWPEKAAFVMIPAILYSYYSYVESVMDKKEKKTYLIMTVILAATQFFFHPQTFGVSLLAIILFTAVISFKEKKLPFNWKTAAVAALVFVLLLAPFLQFPLLYAKNTDVSKGNADKMSLSSLFRWYPPASIANGSVPNDFFSYSYTFGIWTLPLLLLGVLSLALNRKRRDFLMLSWLVTIYLCYHLGIIGFTGRIHRFLAGEAHLFIPLMTIGLLGIVSFFKLSEQKKTFFRYGLAAAFMIAVITMSAPLAYENMKYAYSGASRITGSEYDATVWLTQNTPENSYLRIAGTLVPAKKKFMGFLAFDYPVYDYQLLGDTHPNASQANYLLVDYNDIIASQRSDIAQGLLSWEKNLSKDKYSLVYNTDSLRVYKIED